MKIYIIHGLAFIEIASGYLLYLGKQEFVEDLSPEDLNLLVEETLFKEKTEQTIH